MAITLVVQKGKEIRVFGDGGRQLSSMRLYSDSDKLLGFTSGSFSVLRGKFNPFIYTYDEKCMQRGTPIRA